MTRSGPDALVLVHGAWHGGWCWQAVGERLTAAGVAWVAPDLPLTSYRDDVAAVRAIIDDPDRHFIVVAHSRGGVVASCATEHSTNVRHLVYLSAPMLEPGRAKLAQRRHTLREVAVREQDGHYAVDPEHAAEFLYGGCDPATVAAAVARLRPTASQSDDDVAGYGAGWQHIASTYVVCSDDRCIHPDDQRAMAANAAEVIELAAGHSAQLSRPDEVADLLVDLARRYGLVAPA